MDGRLEQTTTTPDWVYDAIGTAGATQAIVSFSGGGDEGGTTNITLTKPATDGHGHEIVEEFEPYDDPAGIETLNSFLTHLPYDQEEIAYNGDYFIDGRVVIDVIERKTTWDVDFEEIE